MKQTPSLPPPSGPTCPNCGAARTASVAFCANCGAALPPVKGKSSLALVGKIIVTILLFTGAIGLGALGACFAILGGMSNSSSSTNVNTGAMPMFGFAIVLAIAGVAWIVFWARRE